MLLTNRDREILKALTHHVRVFSLDQIARTWWADSEVNSPTRSADTRLKQLKTAGLVTIERLPARPELPLQSPVFSWSPSEPDPHFAAISYRLQNRWRDHPVLTPCVSASKIAANRFGGYGGRPPRAVERTHDIHMAGVYLIYRTVKPETLPFWVFEEQVKAERRKQPRILGEKLPDVIIRTPESTRVVEFGGAYGTDKVVAFHGYCKDRSLSYELW